MTDADYILLSDTHGETASMAEDTLVVETTPNSIMHCDYIAFANAHGPDGDRAPWKTNERDDPRVKSRSVPERYAWFFQTTEPEIEISKYLRKRNLPGDSQ